MIKPDLSRILAKKHMFAVFNKDEKMIRKIESIKSEDDITEDIINYSLKTKSYVKKRK